MLSNCHFLSIRSHIWVAHLTTKQYRILAIPKKHKCKNWFINMKILNAMLFDGIKCNDCDIRKLEYITKIPVLLTHLFQIMIDNIYGIWIYAAYYYQHRVCGKNVVLRSALSIDQTQIFVCMDHHQKASFSSLCMTMLGFLYKLHDCFLPIIII